MASSVSEPGSVTLVLGSQWGDEGKGKLVDVLVPQFEVCARFNGGANAGHTLVVDGIKFAFHLLPCGAMHRSCRNVIGNGVVLHAPTLLNEIDSLSAQISDLNPLRTAECDCKGCGKNCQCKDCHCDSTIRSSGLPSLLISDRCHLLFDLHMEIDGALEAQRSKAIGTTRRGIGPCYATKALRIGLRAGDLLFPNVFAEKFRVLARHAAEKYAVKVDVEAELGQYKRTADILGPSIMDTGSFLRSKLSSGCSVLAEGANAGMLDIDHGTYPFVTSSSTVAGGACTGLGIPPNKIRHCIGVVKAYTTRVGEGPFATELEDEIGKHFRDQGKEFGTTTGRPRRCGWLDLQVVRYTHGLNGYTSLNLTKLDVLTGVDEIKVCTGYMVDGRILGAQEFPGDSSEIQPVYVTMKGWKKELGTTWEGLPEEARKYVELIETQVGVRVEWIGTGPGREHLVVRD